MPKVAFVLVPVFAALLGLAFAGQGRFYAEHLMVALHEHAVGFLLLVPSVLARSQVVTLVSAAAIGLHPAVALRRIYGRSWAGTLWRFGLVGVGYLLSLGLGLGEKRGQFHRELPSPRAAPRLAVFQGGPDTEAAYVP